MFKYMYIDESRDLGEKEGCSKYIVISALLIDNPAPLERIIKNMRRHKFKKELRVFSEFKANNLKDETIAYALEQLNSVKNAQVFHMILEKKKMYSDFLKNDRHKCYNFVAGKLARNIIHACHSSRSRYTFSSFPKSYGKEENV